MNDQNPEIVSHWFFVLECIGACSIYMEENKNKLVFAFKSEAVLCIGKEFGLCIGKEFGLCIGKKFGLCIGK